MAARISLGPLLIDIAGTSLSKADRDILLNPLVGGVILFSRNFTNKAQIAELIQTIRELRTPRLLITVDHEGGRVQRWREGFTAIPAMGTLGKLYDTQPALALEQAFRYGKIAAQELTDVGVDLNYAPVLDIDYGRSKVINAGRAFHHQPSTVAQLAQAYIRGLNAAGMQAIGKHFPGHGGVIADSHYQLPQENRDLSTIMNADVVPFAQLMANKLLAGVMTAHIFYSAIDQKVATLSTFWLKNILRQQLKFSGAVISDDLSMHAMQCIGDYPQRVRRALAAGCDLILLCNNRNAVEQVINSIDAWNITDEVIKKLYAVQK